jgi:hypothetical protein
LAKYPQHPHTPLGGGVFKVTIGRVPSEIKYSLRGEQNTIVLMTIPLEIHVILSSQTLRSFFRLLQKSK